MIGLVDQEQVCGYILLIETHSQVLEQCSIFSCTSNSNPRGEADPNGVESAENSGRFAVVKSGVMINLPDERQYSRKKRLDEKDFFKDIEWMLKEQLSNENDGRKRCPDDGCR